MTRATLALVTSPGLLRGLGWLRSLGSLLSISALLGCAPTPTQLVVVVDSDLSIPAALDEVRLTVRDPAGELREDEQALARASDLPLTLSVIAEGEALGPIEVHAAGYLDDALVVERHATASLARGESRVLVMHLVQACVGVDCGSAALTCTESGCRPRAASDLPEWTGRPPRLDGAVPRDAPPMDGGDAGRPPDGSIDAPRDAPLDVPPVACERDEDCDDGVACTSETCFENTCAFVANDAACDDGNACTDEVCVVGLGCSPSFNTDPCGETTCGGYGSCDYADGCDEAASQRRTCTDRVCMSGTCAAVDRTETIACDRDTDGMACGSTSCGGYDACDYTDVCDEAASQRRTCTDPICMAGACGTRIRTETTSCDRDTDGMGCGPSRVCGGGTCLLCTRTVSGGVGTVGTSYFTSVTGAGNALTFYDAAGMTMGSISVPGVTFSGSVTLPIAIWQVIGMGSSVRFIDWNGTDAGSIAVSGASVSGSHMPPCSPTPYGCFPAYVQRVSGSGANLVLSDSGGGTGMIAFACP